MHNPPQAARLSIDTRLMAPAPPAAREHPLRDVARIAINARRFAPPAKVKHVWSGGKALKKAARLSIGTRRMAPQRDAAVDAALAALHASANVKSPSPIRRRSSLGSFFKARYDARSINPLRENTRDGGSTDNLQKAIARAKVTRIYSGKD